MGRMAGSTKAEEILDHPTAPMLRNSAMLLGISTGTGVPTHLSENDRSERTCRLLSFASSKITGRCSG